MAWNVLANPDTLVDTDWVARHLGASTVRIVESSKDPGAYASGHIPGAVEVDWLADLQSCVNRDVVPLSAFEELLAIHDIANVATVVFYGDCNNVRAASAYWIFKLFGHSDCRIMDGGRKKWKAEGRPLTRETPAHRLSAYQAKPADLSIRAFRDQVLGHIYADRPLVDTRSEAEYTGETIHSGRCPRETAQRVGHIPTARNIPWMAAINPDGTFQEAQRLRELYLEKGITPDRPVITYSGAGERSAHTWFVLSQLLGYPDVRNYDGSWTEWGSLIRAPIER